MRPWYLLLFVLLSLVFCDETLTKGTKLKEHKEALLKVFKLNDNAAASKETVKNISFPAVETREVSKKEKLFHCFPKCDSSSAVHRNKAQLLNIAKNKTKEMKKSFRPYDDDEDDYEQRYPGDEELSDGVSERTRDYEIDYNDEAPLKHRHSDEEETSASGKHGRLDDEYVDDSSTDWEGASFMRHRGRGKKLWDVTHKAFSEPDDDYEEPSFSRHKFRPRISLQSSYSDDDTYDEPTFVRPRFHPRPSRHKAIYSDDDTYEEPSFSRLRFRPRLSSQDDYSDDDADDEPDVSGPRFRPRRPIHSAFSEDEYNYDEPRPVRARFRPRLIYYRHRHRFPRPSIYSGYRRYDQATHVWPSSSQGYQRSSLMPLPAHAPYGARSFGWTTHPIMQQAWWQPPPFSLTAYPPPNPFVAQLARAGIIGNYRRSMFSIPRGPSGAFFIPPNPRNFSPAYQASYLQNLGVETAGTLSGIESTLDKFLRFYHTSAVPPTVETAGSFFRSLSPLQQEVPEPILTSLRGLNIQRRARMLFSSCFRACGRCCQ